MSTPEAMRPELEQALALLRIRITHCAAGVQRTASLMATSIANLDHIADARRRAELVHDRIASTVKLLLEMQADAGALVGLAMAHEHQDKPM